MFTCHQAVGELQRLHANAKLGLTTLRGKYYDRAVAMQFRKVDDLHLCGGMPPRRTMWLYVSERSGAVCCGDKE